MSEFEKQIDGADKDTATAHLILTRTEGQSIIIGDNIRITIEGIKAGRVKIGIEAPKYVIILREELKAK